MRCFFFPDLTFDGFQFQMTVRSKKAPPKFQMSCLSTHSLIQKCIAYVYNVPILSMPESTFLMFARLWKKWREDYLAS